MIFLLEDYILSLPTIFHENHLGYEKGFKLHGPVGSDQGENCCALIMLGCEMINSLTTLSIESMQLTRIACTFILCKPLKHSRPGFVHRPVTYTNSLQIFKIVSSCISNRIN